MTEVDFADLPKSDQTDILENLSAQMKAAAKELDFETAAKVRDNIMKLKKQAGR